MWWLNLLWSFCDHKTLRWCDTEDISKEKNPWHYWATHWAVAQNFQWCEIINFPCGKSRMEILSLTPGSVLTGTPGKQPQFYSHVDYFFLFKSIFQGPLCPLSLGENGYTLIVAWKKLWFEGLATSNSHLSPPMKWDVHFMKYPKGMGLIPECEGGLVNFLFLCVPMACKKVKKCQNRLPKIVRYSYVLMFSKFMLL